MKCINCDAEIKTQNLIQKHDVDFCSTSCLEAYEVKLKKLATITDWDNCC